MSYPGRDFDPLDVTEIVILSFDFAKIVEDGEVLLDPVWQCVAIEGVDASANSRLIGGPSLAGTVTSQQFGTLVAGVKYRVQAAVDTSLGNHYVLWSHIEGTAPA